MNISTYALSPYYSKARLCLCLLFFVKTAALSGQFVDLAAFQKMSDAARLRFIHDFSFEKLDSAALVGTLAQLTAAAEAVHDVRSVYAVKYYRFYEREKQKFTQAETRKAEAELESLADRAGLEVEKTVAHHYAVFEDHYAGKIPHEQLYAEVLHTFSEMERLGFEKFRDYHIEAILNHLGGFMLELNDHERARQYLLVAERFIEPTLVGSYHYTLTLNRLQSCFQEIGDLPNALDRAQKILASNEKLLGEFPPRERWRPLFWQGLALLDIASMLTEQGNLAEGERYAERGYALSKVADDNGIIQAWRGEFDALQVLISVKLKTGKTGEAAPLLHRSQTLKNRLDKEPNPDPYPNLKYLKNRARYHELMGEYGESVRFARQVQVTQDSLDRKNDARKYEQIQRRLDAEKFQEKIRLVESEKQLQTILRNAALVILLLTLALGWAQFARIRARRRLAEAELQAANDRLDTLTTGFQEKSAMVERMRAEVEKVAAHDQRAKLLEELTHTAILTNEDWAHFRLLFEKVHPGFVEAQAAQFPGITAAELRLVVFEKLGLSDHEIANLLGVSHATVQQTRWRMRKKTNPEKGG